MKILVYYGQYDNEYWLADTKERLNAAFKQLFNLLDKMGCYDREYVKHVTKARAGNLVAIKGILESRQCHEPWSIEEVTNPL